MKQKKDIAENQMGICHTMGCVYNHGTVMTNKNNTQNHV